MDEAFLLCETEVVKGSHVVKERSGRFPWHPAGYCDPQQQPALGRWLPPSLPSQSHPPLHSAAVRTRIGYILRRCLRPITSSFLNFCRDFCLLFGCRTLTCTCSGSGQAPVCRSPLRFLFPWLRGGRRVIVSPSVGVQLALVSGLPMSSSFSSPTRSCYILF